MFSVLFDACMWLQSVCHYINWISQVWHHWEAIILLKINIL